MATWPSGNKASTTNLDAGTDKPSLARADIKQNVDNVNDIIDMFNISAPTNNQILKYNSTNTRFELSSDVDTNTTYSISAETATGGANLRLTGSDTTTDDVKLAAGTGISVSQTDANTITITNTQSDSDTLYSISAETATGGVNLRLTGTNLVTDDVKLAEGSNITLTRTDANTITIAATDTTGVTVTNDTTTNATRYIVFEDVTSGSSTGVGVSSTKLTFNPSTGAVTATSFVGALTGNADTATTATGATNINISTTNGNTNDSTMFPVLVAANTTGNQLPHIDQADLTYNASNGTLSAAAFSGDLNGNATTATGATNINISTTNGNTNDSTLYPVMVGNNATGNQLPHIDAVGMMFNASANRLILGNAFTASTSEILLNASGGGSHTIKSSNTANDYTLILPTSNGTSGQVLSTDGAGNLSWVTRSTTSGTVTSVSGTGTVNGLTLTGTVTSSGSLTLGGTLSLVSPPAIGSTTPNTGAFTTLSASTTTTNGALNATYNPSTATGAAIQTSGGITQGGAGFFDFLKPTNTTAGATNPNKSFRLNSTGGLEVVNSAYTSIILTLTDAGALTVPSVTSSGSLTFKDTREAIFDLGTTGGTIAPNVANGSVQKITLNAALTINAFTTPVAGQSLTLIIYGGTAYTSITSTMKFLGGVKTLTGTAGCIDILTVYYDGTTYFAALGKGYA